MQARPAQDQTLPSITTIRALESGFASVASDAAEAELAPPQVNARTTAVLANIIRISESPICARSVTATLQRTFVHLLSSRVHGRMVPGMKKGEATRARIVEEAARQGSVRGLAAVSLNDVATAIGISKSGVFKHFDAKEDLHRAVLEATVQRYLDVIWAPAVRLPQGVERLSLIFERWIDWVEHECGPGGCLIMQASREYDDQPGPLRDYLRTCHLRWQKTMIGEIRAVRPDMTAEEADDAAFDLKSYILGFAEQRRLLDDESARRKARGSFGRWLARQSLEPTAKAGV